MLQGLHAAKSTEQEAPCSWATWLRLLRKAHHTPCSSGCETHLLRWEECFSDTSFCWHAAHRINNNNRSGTFLSGLQNKQGNEKKKKPPTHKSMTNAIKWKRNHTNISVSMTRFIYSKMVNRKSCCVQSGSHWQWKDSFSLQYSNINKTCF